MASKKSGSSGRRSHSQAALVWLRTASGFHSVTATQRSKYPGSSVEYTDGRIRWSRPDRVDREIELREVPCSSNWFLVTTSTYALWRQEPDDADSEATLWMAACVWTTSWRNRCIEKVGNEKLHLSEC